MAQPEELESISRLLEGELSDEGAQALEDQIRQRPDLADAQRRLEALVSVSASLRDDITEGHAARLVDAVLPKAPGHWRWWLVGAASVAALAAVLLIVLRPGKSTHHDDMLTVATVGPTGGIVAVAPPDGARTQLDLAEIRQPSQPTPATAAAGTPVEGPTLVEQVRSLQADRAALQRQVADLEKKISRAPASTSYVVSAEVTAYFDVKRVIQGVDDASDRRSVLEKDVRAKQKQLDQMKADTESMQSDYEARRSLLSPAAQQEQEARIRDRRAEAQSTFAELQKELDTKEREALSELLGRLEPVVQELAQTGGYAYVFEKNEAGLYYAPTAHDLTTELIRRYNERYPGKGKSKSPP